MWKSKARELACASLEAQAQDRLLRHYRKIAAPAVAAAVNVGTQTAPRETADAAAQAALAAPAFLRWEDHAA
ncbi:MAG: hypothetical protein ACR652_08250 [Methylocystis sp.]|uniref:hypothetical protein n=1 Tax=Methylocystis sp. TaxID=1911079 RepID=UPI003DA362DE